MIHFIDHSTLKNHKIATVKDTIIDDIPVWHVEIDAIDDLEASEDTIEEIDEFLAFLPQWLS